MGEEATPVSYSRSVRRRVRAWRAKRFGVIAAGGMIALPFLLVGEQLWPLVFVGLWLSFLAALECYTGRVLGTGLLPRLNNPGTLHLEENGFTLLGGHSPLRSRWSDIEFARLLLPAGDYVPAGFVETIELHYSDTVARVPWDADGLGPWLEHLKSAVKRHEVVQPKFASWSDLGGDLS